MRKRTLAATTGVAALSLVLPTAATALTRPVTLRAELDLPSFERSVGPRTFEAVGVVVGDGPELGLDDEVANPSNWCGDVLVDVDPAGQTITVSADQRACDFEVVTVVLDTEEITSVDVVTDGLATTGSDGATPATGVALATDVTDGVVTLRWTGVEGETEGETAIFYMGGTSTFHYEWAPAAPPAPPTPPAAPATPTAARPAYTG